MGAEGRDRAVNMAAATKDNVASATLDAEALRIETPARPAAAGDEAPAGAN
jgi:hypothetical protein